MPTNHTTQSRCTALSSRLTRLALEAHDLAVLLQAEEITPWETELYLGPPAGLLQMVLDELYWAIDRVWGTPVGERARQLEVSRIIAAAIPPERRAACIENAAPSSPSAGEASIAGWSER